MKSPSLRQSVRVAIIALVSALLIVAAALTGCKLSSLSNSKTPSELIPSEIPKDADVNQEGNNETNDPTPTPPVVKKSYKVLTGLETTSELADLRPVAVSLANGVYSLPQYGVGSGEILIEVPLADGSTRLAMLTTNYRAMPTIGSVDSTRPYLLEICEAFHAIQCFNGSDDTITPEEFAAYDVLDHASQNLAGMYYYDDTRFDQTDLMTNGILIDAAIRKAEYADTDTSDYMPFLFAAEGTTISPGTASATTVGIRYSDDLRVSYLYDAATDRYIRYEYGEKQIDAATGEAVSFDNLFILCASTVTYETENEKTLDLVMEDGGSGYYISRGTYVPFTWTRAEDGTLDFYQADDTRLVVNRGTSYIGFVAAGEKSAITIS